MKKLPYFLLMLLATVSCSKDFLDENDKSLITPEEFFMDSRDAQSAVNAIYSHLDGESFYARYFWLITALTSDIGEDRGNEPDLAEFSDFALTPQNGIVAKAWSDLYAGIHTASFAIKNIPRAPVIPEERDRLVAEARFFRGMFYLDLVRLFGDVPLDTFGYTDVNIDLQLVRSPVDTVYQLIEADLTFAFENLPDNNGTGRPNRFSALAYISKLSLLRGKYSTAFQANRVIITSNRFSLLPDYGDVFRIANNNSQEHVFSINFSNAHPGPMNRETLSEGLGGRPLTRPGNDLLNSFDPESRRLQVSFLKITDGPFVTKYWDPAVEPEGGYTANDLPLVRYADVLLMHAEAINELSGGPNSEALAAINTVRQRARFLNDTTQLNILPDLGSMSQAAFREVLLEERKKELAFEGHRWFDLKRFGVLAEKVAKAKPGTEVSDTYLLLPVPQREIDKNPALKQNPGY